MKKRLIEGIVICAGLLWATTLNFKELGNFQLAALYVLGIWMLSFALKLFRSR